MKLAYWMYAGPAHIGVLRVSSSFKNVHAIMHAPLGDDYFNVMRSMLERERDFTPVTASIVDRHVLARGSQEKVVENITRKNKEETPDLIILTPTCTSSILQEDLHNFVERVSCNTLMLASEDASIFNQTDFALENQDVKTKQKNNELTSSQFLPENSQSISQPGGMRPQHAKHDELEPDIILADVNHYRVNELQAADRTLEQIVRFYLEKAKKQNILNKTKTEKPSVNIIGIFTLGFHNQHDCRELKRLFNDLGIKINEIIPEGGDVNKLKNLPQAWFNFVPYREVGLMTAMYLKSEFNMPYVSITPMGLIDTAACIRAICNIIIDCSQLKSPAILNQPGGIGNFWDYVSHTGDHASRTGDVCPQGCTQEAESHSHCFTVVPMAQPCEASFGKTNKNLNAKQGSQYVKHGPQDAEHEKLSNTNISNFIKKNDIPSKTQLPKASKLAQAQNLNNIEILFNKYIDQQTRFVSQSAWFSRSIDCQNLTGKKVVVFGDATHSAAMTKILSREMGIRVACAGTYCKHDADWFREQVSGFCDQILITDDHTQVGQTIENLEPAAIFGTQMERHVGKRLDIPCGVISAPVHIQNFPLGYRPFLGYEGTNQIADLVYNSFNLGMEDHLLQIFGGHDTNKEPVNNEIASNKQSLHGMAINNHKKELWSPEGLVELNKVPGFVRGKVKRNTEKFALQNNIPVITVEVMYAAKEALSM